MITTPPRAPRAHCDAQRWVATRECTDGLLILGERPLGAVRGASAQHDTSPRPHRGLQQLPPVPISGPPGLTSRAVRRRQILGGLINEGEQVAWCLQPLGAVLIATGRSHRSQR